MLRRLIYILLVIIPLQGVRAGVLNDDTTRVEVRSFNPEKITKYQKNDRYNYKTRESWLHRIWNRFLEWLGKLVGKQLDKRKVGNSSGAGNVMTGIIIVAAIVLLILGLSKTKFRTWITGKGAVVEQEYEVEEENIHDIDFDRDIRDAERDEDYRRAIRLLFLKVLKSLSDSEMIYWDPNKTNHQYLYELKGTNAYSAFVNCVNVFDLVWYGEWKIDKAYYLSNKPAFEELVKKSTKIKTAVFNG